MSESLDPKLAESLEEQERREDGSFPSLEQAVEKQAVEKDSAVTKDIAAVQGDKDSPQGSGEIIEAEVIEIEAPEERAIESKTDKDHLSGGEVVEEVTVEEVTVVQDVSSESDPDGSAFEEFEDVPVDGYEDASDSPDGVSDFSFALQDPPISESEIEAAGVQSHLLKQFLEEEASDSESIELQSLIAELEDQRKHLRAERERVATLRSLADMEITQAREQSKDLESQGASLASQREEIKKEAESLEATRSVVHAERERTRMELAEASRASVGAQEKEKRISKELDEAEALRDQAASRMRAAEARAKEIDRTLLDLQKAQKNVEKETRELEIERNSLLDRQALSEEQRKTSLEVLEGATNLRRAAEKSLEEARARQADMEAERERYETLRLEAEEKIQEYEQKLTETSAIRNDLFSERELAAQARAEAERERDILVRDLEAQKSSLAQAEALAKSEVTQARETLALAEEELGKSEQERHSLRAELARLEGVARDSAIKDRELQESRQWVARARELEEEVVRLRSSEGADAGGLASDLAQKISDTLGANPSADPLVIGQLREILGEMMSVASGQHSVLEIRKHKAEQLMNSLASNLYPAETINPPAPQAQYREPSTPVQAAPPPIPQAAAPEPLAPEQVTPFSLEQVAAPLAPEQVTPFSPEQVAAPLAPEQVAPPVPEHLAPPAFEQVTPPTFEQVAPSALLVSSAEEETPAPPQGEGHSPSAPDPGFVIQTEAFQELGEPAPPEDILAVSAEENQEPPLEDSGESRKPSF